MMCIEPMLKVISGNQIGRFDVSIYTVRSRIQCPTRVDGQGARSYGASSQCTMTVVMYETQQASHENCACHIHGYTLSDPAVPVAQSQSTDESNYGLSIESTHQ